MPTPEILAPVMSMISSKLTVTFPVTPLTLMLVPPRTDVATPVKLEPSP